MPQAPLPPNEEQRLYALHNLAILDTPREQVYEDIVQLASTIMGVPIGLISLVDKNRQWFKAHCGLDATETPREQSFCAHAILDPEQMLVVPDATQDERFADNPLVTGAPHIRFYAGVPLNLSSGLSVGTLCVISTKPYQPTDEQLELLKKLGRMAVHALEAHEQANKLQRYELNLAQLEELTGYGHWAVDVKRGSVYWSPEVYRIHGLDPELYVPNLKEGIEFYHPDDRNMVQQKVNEAINKGEPFEFEARLQWLDGTVVPVFSKAQIQHNQAGEVTGFFGVFRPLEPLPQAAK
jgi:PAS domain-containing protein